MKRVFKEGDEGDEGEKPFPRKRCRLVDYTLEDGDSNKKLEPSENSKVFQEILGTYISAQESKNLPEGQLLPQRNLPKQMLNPYTFLASSDSTQIPSPFEVKHNTLNSFYRKNIFFEGHCPEMAQRSSTRQLPIKVSTPKNYTLKRKPRSASIPLKDGHDSGVYAQPRASIFPKQDLYKDYDPKFLGLDPKPNEQTSSQALQPRLLNGNWRLNASDSLQCTTGSNITYLRHNAEFKWCPGPEIEKNLTVEHSPDHELRLNKHDNKHEDCTQAKSTCMKRNYPDNVDPKAQIENNLELSYDHRSDFVYEQFRHIQNGNSLMNIKEHKNSHPRLLKSESESISMSENKHEQKYAFAQGENHLIESNLINERENISVHENKHEQKYAFAQGENHSIESNLINERENIISGHENKHERKYSRTHWKKHAIERNLRNERENGKNAVDGLYIEHIYTYKKIHFNRNVSIHECKNEKCFTNQSDHRSEERNECTGVAKSNQNIEHENRNRATDERAPTNESKSNRNFDYTIEHNRFKVVRDAPDLPNGSKFARNDYHGGSFKVQAGRNFMNLHEPLLIDPQKHNWLENNDENIIDPPNNHSALNYKAKSDVPESIDDDSNSIDLSESSCSRMKESSSFSFRKFSKSIMPHLLKRSKSPEIAKSKLKEIRRIIQTDSDDIITSYPGSTDQCTQRYCEPSTGRRDENNSVSEKLAICGAKQSTILPENRLCQKQSYHLVDSELPWNYFYQTMFDQNYSDVEELDEDLPCTSAQARERELRRSMNLNSVHTSKQADTNSTNDFEESDSNNSDKIVLQSALCTIKNANSDKSVLQSALCTIGNGNSDKRVVPRDDSSSQEEPSYIRDDESSDPRACSLQNNSSSSFSSRKRKFNSESEVQEVRCGICYVSTSVKGEHQIISLRCGHLFGKKCIINWLYNNQNFCPTCSLYSDYNHIRPLKDNCITVLDNKFGHDLRRDVNIKRRRLDSLIQERDKLLGEKDSETCVKKVAFLSGLLNVLSFLLYWIID